MFKKIRENNFAFFLICKKKDKMNYKLTVLTRCLVNFKTIFHVQKLFQSLCQVCQKFRVWLLVYLCWLVNRFRKTFSHQQSKDQKKFGHFESKFHCLFTVQQSSKKWCLPVTTDTCNAARAFRRILIDEHITGAFEYDCMNHLRNVWFANMEKSSQNVLTMRW